MKDNPRRQHRNTGSFADDLINFFTSSAFILALVLLYVVVIGLLLLAELDVSGLAQFRATDKVVILFVLLFMPFFIVAAPKFINSLTLKFGGGREVQVQLNKVSEHIDSAIVDIQHRIARQVNTAEQCLWPILAGIDPYAESRWRRDPPLIIIGGKEDVSHLFFSNFLKHWLEKQIPGIECVVRYPNGGSLKNFADIKHHWIDMYIDFTGTCCQYFCIDHHGKTDQQIVDQLNSYCLPMQLEFMPMLQATENYLLVMRRETAEQHNIDSLSDLSRAAPLLTFTADPEYLNRNDCWLGLQKAYGIKFREIIPCHVTDRYALLEEDAADIFVGYQTDPEIQVHNLKILQDNKQFFPNYAALPLVNRGLLDAVPAIREALEQLQDTITTDDLIDAVREISDGIRDLPDILLEQEKKVRKRAGARNAET